MRAPRNAWLVPAELPYLVQVSPAATAAQIQQALLPTRSRTGRFFDAVAEMLPCRSIGGDFFEYIDLPDGRFGFALGDVSGKGPPAALLGALTQGSLAAQTAVASGPAAALARLNTALVRRAIEGRFVALFHAQRHALALVGPNAAPAIAGPPPRGREVTTLPTSRPVA